MSNLKDAIQTVMNFIDQCEGRTQATVKSRKAKTTQSPKKQDGRGKSAYNQFVSENMKLIRSQNPNMAQPDIMKVIGTMWKKNRCASNPNKCLKTQRKESPARLTQAQIVEAAERAAGHHITKSSGSKHTMTKVKPRGRPYKSTVSRSRRGVSSRRRSINTRKSA